jgi:type I restriction-modification system DNA methylase subunit
MGAPQELLQLVEQFDRNADAYRSGRYNETMLRREYVDPLFTLLGWDVDNKQGWAEAYKEVIHEDAIKVGGATKAPDYCFRIGGTRKFFVEAKKPSVNLKDEVTPAFQLRRYAWSAKLALSILTDFEEFAVYDCRVKPGKDDRPSAGRTLYLTCTDYADRWDEIAAIFSKEAVLQGSFDKYAESGKRKRGTAEVDTAFLDEIESWRDMVAKNLALRNSGLSTRELNFAVQRTIDRIIFLRICEDRGIELYGQLMSLLNGEEVYPRLCDIFRRADERYNSGLFHFQAERGRSERPDDLTLRLNIDDKPLKTIIRSLYYPDSPYEFSVLPADILGQVYEQFLGKVIRLTAGHRAVVEDKPEVKKAGGVYYTPTYIVDYIVKNTVGKLVEGKTPQQVEKLTILDPACGSGSFLIGAYQYLLNGQRDWYSQNDPDKWAKGRNPRVYQGSGGDWRLTTAERKRILLNTIYGVDIDPQAVEVTKLSLLLKVLEGESAETIGSQLRLFHERALPDLGSNIKCGNSLIGPDFYASQQMSFLDDEERYRINAFDWQAEFPEIFTGNTPGFDAVIGNPPYIFTREQLSIPERKYFTTHYHASWEKHNTFILFMEAILRLLNSLGKGSLIVPNSWLTIESGKLLRSALLDKIEVLADLNYQVFERVSMEPCIFVIHGSATAGPIRVFRAKSKDAFLAPRMTTIPRSRWTNGPARFVFSEDSQAADLVDHIVQRCTITGEKFDVRSGLQAYERGKGTPPQTAEDVRNHIFDRDSRQDAKSFKYLQGRDVARYRLDWSGMWMQYGPWLAQPREVEIFRRPRLLLREITGPLPYCLHSTFVGEPYLNNKSVLNILHDKDDEAQLKLLAAVLNSRLMSVYYKSRAVKSARRIFPKVVIKNVREFPFPKTVSEDVLARSNALVDRMLALHKHLTTAKTDHEKTAIQRQIPATDREIDNLVYELYGLTEEEIAIVESNNR